MITWPESLIPEVAERRCLIVLGAGVSASCVSLDRTKRPPTWPQLLYVLLDRIPNADDATEAKRLLERGDYLQAAQIIRTSVPSPDFDQIIRHEFHDPRYQPSRLHEIINKLDPKAVLTTNYDDIYERFSVRDDAANAYNVCNYYDGHALNDIRSTTRIILKIHGSVSDPTRVVLTLADYFNARRTCTSFYAILDSLFLTNTLLFLGCGLSDPDIALLLENANISAPSSHPHYAVVEDVRHAAIKAAFKQTYNLELLEYEATKHDEVVTSLQGLLEQVEEYRQLH